MAYKIAGNSIICSTLYDQRWKYIKLHFVGPPAKAGFPPQRTSNGESIFSSWRYYCSCLGLYRGPWRRLRDPVGGNFRAKLRRMDTGSAGITLSQYIHLDIWTVPEIYLKILSFSWFRRDFQYSLPCVVMRKRRFHSALKARFAYSRRYSLLINCMESPYQCYSFVSHW